MTKVSKQKLESVAETDLQQLISRERVVLFLTADWSGPCRILEPLLILMSNRDPGVVFRRVDVDKMPDVAVQYDVRSIPTLLFFSNEALKNRIVGIRSLRELEAIIQETFN